MVRPPSASGIGPGQYNNGVDINEERRYCMNLSLHNLCFPYTRRHDPSLGTRGSSLWFGGWQSSRKSIFPTRCYLSASLECLPCYDQPVGLQQASSTTALGQKCFADFEKPRRQAFHFMLTCLAGARRESESQTGLPERWLCLRLSTVRLARAPRASGMGPAKQQKTCRQ